MSTGLSFGLKLPTGRFIETLLDRDTQIGSGTTDVLISAYQMAQENGWGWYVQGALASPLSERNGYKPGNDFNAAVGFHYDGLNSSFGVVPIASIVASLRGRDSGSQADPENSGYPRLFVSAGVEVVLSKSIHFDVDTGLPIYSRVNGNQLISPQLLNSTLRYQFSPGIFHFHPCIVTSNEDGLAQERALAEAEIAETQPWFFVAPSERAIPVLCGLRGAIDR